LTFLQWFSVRVSKTTQIVKSGRKWWLTRHNNGVHYLRVSARSPEVPESEVSL
jgi:hypothetical protein